jgi:GTPase SAR1 family protein
MSSSSYDYLFKVVVLGEGAVGKTAIVTRFSHGFFRTDYKTTIGSQFAVKNITVTRSDGSEVTVKLQIWDVAGQSRFQILRPMYYRGSSGGILVYDVTRRRTFMVLQVPDRVVEPAEGRRFADEHNMPYIESSAKTGEGIIDIFSKLGKTLALAREAHSNSR